MIGAWPSSWPSQASQQPAQAPPVHVETSFNPTPDAISTCTKQGCVHHNDPGTGPLPAFIWPSPGCLAAWELKRHAANEEAAS